MDVVCGIVGKEKESKKINEEFYAGKGKEKYLLMKKIGHLMERINFLKGVSVE